ncbi:MAG TPA: ABC transporter ATP-binding protein [Planctomycetaceae bacterium]|nr:ABC transporter ATP-binding protein [Planctomycetaceae bacterium]
MSIVARDLRKSFRAVRAVDGVSFEIGRGIVGLIGPNGSGKTTVLRMLATFLQPSAGGIRIAGHDAAADPIAVRRSIGYLPEALPGYVEARVEEFLEFRARLKQIPRRGRRAEVDRCLASCQLTSVRRRLIGRLSQGFRRRAGLADALLGSPPVLLLDEPTVGLDPLQVRQTRDLLKELSDRTTILLSTHLLAEAQAACDRVLMLIRGRLASDVSLAEMKRGNAFEITLRGAAESCEARLRAISGVQSVRRVSAGAPFTAYQVDVAEAAAREDVVRECVAAGWGVCELRNLHDDLESHFVRVSLGLRGEAA